MFTKHIKVVSVILLLAFALTALVGCSIDETKVLNAMIKSNGINTMETDSTIHFSIDTQNLTEDEKEGIDAVSSVLNNLVVKANQKYKRNADKTLTETQSAVTVDLQDTTIKENVWSTSDLRGNYPSYTLTMSVPFPISQMLPEGYRDRKYVTFSTDSMGVYEEAQISAKNVAAISGEAEKLVTEFIKEYAKDFAPSFDFIKPAGSKEINGENIALYELNFDDKALKDFLRYAAVYTADYGKLVDFLKEIYMLELKSVYSGDTMSIPQDEFNLLDDTFKNLKDQLANSKDGINAAFDAIKPVRFIGDKGFVLCFGINPEGYISYTSSAININLDCAAIEKALMGQLENDKYTPGTQAVIDLNIYSETIIKNINKDITITYPALTEENCLDLGKMMKENMDALTKY